MEKIYVRFGDVSKNDMYISVYEAILEGNVVKILMPTTLYSTCQALARNIDLPAYIVMGDIVGKGNNGEPLMSNCKIKIPLVFNKTLETFICTAPIPHKREKKESPNLPKWYK